jgi:heme/copper-type cytochrome/quinol oxidase subunit 2
MKSKIIFLMVAIILMGFAPGCRQDNNKGEKFSDPKGMIDKLHNMGFKVMLWGVPFISSDSPIYRKLAEKFY